MLHVSIRPHKVHPQSSDSAAKHDQQASDKGRRPRLQNQGGILMTPVWKGGQKAASGKVSFAQPVQTLEARRKKGSERDYGCW